MTERAHSVLPLQGKGDAMSLKAHPDCQIPFEELRDAIAQLAVDRVVGVEFDLRPDQD